MRRFKLEKHHPIFALAQLFFTVQKDMLGYEATIPMLKICHFTLIFIIYNKACISHTFAYAI